MKNTTLFFLFSAVMLFSLCTVAQVPLDQNASKFFDDFRMIKNREKAYENIVGSPYIQKDFVKSSITGKDDSVYDNVQLRYNGYDDFIEYKNPQGLTLQLANPENYKEFKIGNDSYIYHNDAQNSLKGYYQILERGKLLLLIKHTVSLRDAVEPKAYADAKPAEFVPKQDSYFALTNNKQLVKIKNTKDLLAIMQDKKNKMSEFIKKNKLKVKKKDDLKQIVAYYNSL